jgi:hypothetical protein
LRESTSETSPFDLDATGIAAEGVAEEDAGGCRGAAAPPSFATASILFPAVLLLLPDVVVVVVDDGASFTGSSSSGMVKPSSEFLLKFGCLRLSS